MPELDIHAKPVTVSIVSHGQWALVEPLLQQLEQWCGQVVERVIVTVNIPEPVRLKDAWPFTLERIDNAQPHGFGANHNAAFRRCTTPWFLILNPDIRLEQNILSPLLAAARPEAALLTPRIREPHREVDEPYRGLLTPLELVRRRQANHRAPAQPAWVAGMFMLIRREAFEQVNGFDPRYFMYCEDFDLCARLRLAGWSLCAVSSERVLHIAQRASQSSLRPLVWHLSSFIKVWTSRAFWRYRALLSA